MPGGEAHHIDADGRVGGLPAGTGVGHHPLPPAVATDGHHRRGQIVAVDVRPGTRGSQQSDPRFPLGNHRHDAADLRTGGQCGRRRHPRRRRQPTGRQHGSAGQFSQSAGSADPQESAAAEQRLFLSAGFAFLLRNRRVDQARIAHAQGFRSVSRPVHRPESRQCRNGVHCPESGPFARSAALELHR